MAGTDLGLHLVSCYVPFVRYVYLYYRYVFSLKSVFTYDKKSFVSTSVFEMKLKSSAFVL